MRKIYYDFSPIGGSGIFAKQAIRKDETVFKITGDEIIRHAYTRTFSPSGPNWVAVDREAWLIPSTKNPWPYINHSCEPNVGFRGSREVVAMRDIAPDEEVVIDYAITEEDPYWRMQCCCRAKKCRKEIASAPNLPPRLIKKYQKYLPTFLNYLVSDKQQRAEVQPPPRLKLQFSRVCVKYGHSS